MAILLVLCLATDRDDDALDQVSGSAAKSRTKVQPGIWLLDTRETVEAVRDRLDGRKAGRSGQVLVFRLARRWAGRGVDDRTVWLKAMSGCGPTASRSLDHLHRSREAAFAGGVRMIREKGLTVAVGVDSA